MLTTPSDIDTERTVHVAPDDDRERFHDAAGTDHTKVVLEPGPHYLGTLTDIGEHVAIVGEDGARVMRGEGSDVYWWLQIEPEAPVAVANVTLDFTNRQGSSGILVRSKADALFQDLTFVGHTPVDSQGATDNIAPMATAEDATIVVDGLTRTGSTDIVSHGHLGDSNNNGCLWTGPKHRGRLVLRNWHVENTGTNAIYASRVRGSVEVRDSLFRNNNQVSVRVGGGGDHIVENCVFEVTDSQGHPDNTGGLINPWGCRFETNESKVEPGTVTVRDCDFVWHEAAPDRGGPLLLDGDIPVTVHDIRIHNDSPATLLLARDGPTTVEFRECSFTGAGQGFADEGRDVSLINCCAEVPVPGGWAVDGLSTSKCVRATARDPRGDKAEAAPAWRQLELEAAAGEPVFEYRIAVDGDVEPAQLADTADTISTADGRTVIDGRAGLGGRDTFRFTGDLVDVDLGGQATLRVDGTVIDPSSVGESTGGDVAPATTTVTITPDGGEAVAYAVRLADGAAPVAISGSQSWHPDRRQVIGYTSWWDVTLEVDGGVEWVAADGASVDVAD